MSSLRKKICDADNARPTVLVSAYLGSESLSRKEFTRGSCMGAVAFNPCFAPWGETVGQFERDTADEIEAICSGKECP